MAIITYTTPSGWQCRDRLLFGVKYLKENMDYEATKNTPSSMAD